MKYFKKITASADIQPLLDEIFAVDQVWAEQTGRQASAAVQREALAIPIRGLRKSAQQDRSRRDVHESRWTSGSVRFPKVRAFLEGFAADQGGLLSRAKIVCLPASSRVYPHVDRGEYYKLRDRYHLVLKSEGTAWLKSGDETVYMQEGELWWFDNNQVHEAGNEGTRDRIHFIFDLLPSANAHLAFPQTFHKVQIDDPAFSGN